MKIELPNEYAFRGFFEDETDIRDAYWNISPDDVVIDIGCYYGSYTIPALAAGAQVYAVDPWPVYFDTLRWICEFNNISMSKLVTVAKAIGEFDPDFNAAQSAMPYPDMYPPAGTQFITLEQLVSEYSITRLDWIKMDVEGAELSILRSGQSTIREFKPSMLIEDHSDVYDFVAAMDSERLCLELLDDIGYQVKKVRYEGHKSPDRTFWVCHYLT